MGIHFEKSSDIWPQHWHHNAQNYWSSGEPPLPLYACIYRPSKISSFTVISISKQMMEVVEKYSR